MSETTRMWVEVTFDLLYLVAVWALVIGMLRHRSAVPEDQRALGRLFIGAFALLALGDTGHVGFRALAYLLGDLEMKLTVFGIPLSLVGVGALSTAITVTFFYVLMVVIWHERFGKPYGWPGGVLFVAAAARLVIMLFPQNQWALAVSPQPWSIYRNVPLMIQGLGVAYLILRDATADQDRLFIDVGIMILVSYAFYMPVIFLVQRIPLIGMLMIPKTLAYVAIAVLAFVNLFSPVRAKARRQSAYAQGKVS